VGPDPIIVVVPALAADWRLLAWLADPFVGGVALFTAVAYAGILAYARSGVR
jgi:hypothetical protein